MHTPLSDITTGRGGRERSSKRIATRSYVDPTLLLDPPHMILIPTGLDLHNGPGFQIFPLSPISPDFLGILL